MSAEANKILTEANIPSVFRRADNRLATSKDKLGDELFEFTDPDKPAKFNKAKEKKLWLIYGQPLANTRELTFLLAKALAVTGVEVFCANLNTLQNLLVNGSDDDKEIEFIDRCRTTEFLVLDDFYDRTLAEPWVMSKFPLLHLIRRRIENELITIAYSSDTLNNITGAWPASFTEYLGYHVHYFTLKGKR